MVHGSLVKRIPKGYLYKYTIVFIVYNNSLKMGMKNKMSSYFPPKKLASDWLT